MPIKAIVAVALVIFITGAGFWLFRRNKKKQGNTSTGRRGTASPPRSTS